MRLRLPPLTRRRGPGPRPPGAVPGVALGLIALLSLNANARSGVNESVAVPASVVESSLQSASTEAKGVADWVSSSRDNHGMPYVIIDKVNARVFVFDAHGRVLGADAALLGLARGDRSIAGIGNLKLSTIRPQDRTTPAGRFKASLDRDVHGSEILVIDYEASISMHAVVKGTPAERRAERMRSTTPDDNRISFGCINVPATFYKTIVSPAFRQTYGIVYILPEMSAASEFFGFYDVDTDARNRDSPPVENDATRMGGETAIGRDQRSP